MKSQVLYRISFYFLVIWAAAIFWVGTYPPMIDLPQHVAQVATLQDILSDSSQWDKFVRINLFTPYLVGYGSAVLLSQWMPVLIALKILLSTAYCAFAWSFVLLRKQLGGDPRLDMLCVAGLFGFAYKWGFATFLISAPIGLLFIVLAIRYSKTPTTPSGVTLVLSGLVLFFSHGLIFLMSIGVGALALFINGHRKWAFLLRLIPYAIFIVLSLAYAAITKNRESQLAGNDVDWQYDIQRLFSFVKYICGESKSDWILAPFIASLFLAPWIMGLRISRRPLNWLPFSTIILIWIVVPHFAMQTAFLFERFAIFTLPFYALLFAAPSHQALKDPPTLRELGGQLLIACSCIAVLGVQSIRVERFEKETREFAEILDAARPNERALALIFDRVSQGAENATVYLHFASWYQAEKHGWVDPNFAWFRPQILRYRTEPASKVGMDFAWHPGAFDWKRHDGSSYRYFFVRGEIPSNSALFDNDSCRVMLIKRSGPWALWEALGNADQLPDSGTPHACLKLSTQTPRRP